MIEPTCIVEKKFVGQQIYRGRIKLLMQVIHEDFSCLQDRIELIGYTILRSDLIISKINPNTNSSSEVIIASYTDYT